MQTRFHHSRPPQQLGLARPTAVGQPTNDLGRNDSRIIHARPYVPLRQSMTISSSTFSALADPNRLCILDRLCEMGPCSTKRVTETIPITRQAATKHLELLESVGLISSSRRGRERIWKIHPEMLSRASAYLVHLARRSEDTERASGASGVSEVRGADTRAAARDANVRRFYGTSASGERR